MCFAFGLIKTVQKVYQVVILKAEDISLHWTRLEFLRTVFQFLTKVNILLPYGLAIMLFCIYQKEFKTYIHTKTCTTSV